MKNFLKFISRRPIIKHILILLFYCIYSSVLVSKLLNYTPWIGADTYPFYPRDSTTIITTLTSPWNFYLGRTTLGSGLPYILLLKILLYTIFKQYGEFALVIFWLSVAGYGFYLFSKLLAKSEYLRVIGGALYIVSTFTWHESVHSIYGMLGAYALAPIFSYLTMKVLTLSSERVKFIHAIILSMLLGFLIGVLSISTLFPFYAIYVLFVWLPALISILLRYFLYFRTKNKWSLLKLISILFATLLGFFIPYFISYVGVSITSHEVIGIVSRHQLLQIKKADFSYNYRFNNQPLVLWFIYPWSFINKVLHENIATFILDVIAILLVLYGILGTLSLVKRGKVEMISLYFLLGFMTSIGYIILATEVAKNRELLNIIWSNTVISALLSGITQPIKIGIPASLFISTIILIALNNAVASVVGNHGKGVKAVKTDIKARINRIVVLILLILVVISSFTLYALNLPITEGHKVSEQYNNSLSLLKDLRSKVQSDIFTPRVLIEKGKYFFRYYYTYAVALRPLKPWGSYAKTLPILRTFKFININSTTSSIIAKTFYIGVFINSQRKTYIYNFTYSPVYIVIPFTIEPYNESYYILALTILAQIVSQDNGAISRYLNSMIVFDVVPEEFCISNCYCIHIKILKESKLTVAPPRLSIRNMSWNDIIVLIKDNVVKKVIYNDNFLMHMTDLINRFNSIKLTYELSYIPLKLKVLLNTSKSLKIPYLILRFNEYYSPYWRCDNGIKIHTLSFFNMFLVSPWGKQECISIYHSLWKEKIIILLIMYTLIILGVILLLRPRSRIFS